MSRQKLDNRELDKLVAALGRSKVTWRRAILLHEWLQVSVVANPVWTFCSMLAFILQYTAM